MISSLGSVQSQLLQELRARQGNAGGSAQVDGQTPSPAGAPPASSTTGTSGTSQNKSTDFISQFSADLNSLLLNLQSSNGSTPSTASSSTTSTTDATSGTAANSTSTSTAVNGSDDLQADLGKVANDLGKLSGSHHGHHHHHAPPAQSSDDTSATDASGTPGSAASTNTNQSQSGSLDSLIKALNAYAAPSTTDPALSLVTSA